MGDGYDCWGEGGDWGMGVGKIAGGGGDWGMGDGYDCWGEGVTGAWGMGTIAGGRGHGGWMLTKLTTFFVIFQNYLTCCLKVSR